MLPWIWASFMIHDDPSSARVVHPYLIGDELVGDGIPTRFVIDIAAEDVMTAAAMAPAAFRRIHDLVLPERQAAADQEQQRNREALARHPEARVNRHHEQFLSTWWQLSWRRPTMIAALFRLPRDIALSAHASRAPPARVSFATWLEDDGIPARVIDELMGHEPSSRGAQHLGSAMGPTTATPPQKWQPGWSRRSRPG